MLLWQEAKEGDIMKSGKRKRYDGRFKARVALEAVKGEKITAEMSRTRAVQLKCPAEPVENASRFPTASTESVDDTYLYCQTFQDTTFMYLVLCPALGVHVKKSSVGSPG